MKKLNSIPRDLRLPILLAILTLVASCIHTIIGFCAALLAGTYGWIVGLISLPMKRYRRMFACFGLIIFCIAAVWLSAFFHYPTP